MINKKLHYKTGKKHYLIGNYKLGITNIKQNAIQSNLILYNRNYHYQKNLVQYTYKKLNTLLKPINKIDYNIILLSNGLIYNQIKKLSKKQTITICINKKKQFKTNWLYNQIKLIAKKTPNLIFAQNVLNKALLQNILNDKIPLITNNTNNYSDFTLLLKQNNILSQIFSLQGLINKLNIKGINI